MEIEAGIECPLPVLVLSPASESYHEEIGAAGNLTHPDTETLAPVSPESAARAAEALKTTVPGG